MEADQIFKLIGKCLQKGDPEDWKRLRLELQKPENALLQEELFRMQKLTPADLVIHSGKMWEVVSKCQTAGSNRTSLRRRILRYAAIIALPLMLGGLIIWLGRLKENAEPKVAVATILEPGQSKAILRLNDGQQIDLSAISSDTVIRQNGALLRLDSSRSISYQLQGGENTEMAYNVIVVPRSGEYRLVLADGSVVWLNSDSELKYPVVFSGNQRKVYLKGEAYFEVAKDKTKPFSVEVGDMEVQVLGTCFNINAYRVDGTIQTTLVSGKVKVSDRHSTRSVILKPDEQAELQNGQIITKEVDAAVYTAWRDGRFYFESEPLEEIAAQLERWYDIHFFFTRESLKQEEFTGVIRRDYTADQILEIITKTTNVKFEIKGRSVTVR